MHLQIRIPFSLSSSHQYSFIPFSFSSIFLLHFFLSVIFLLPFLPLSFSAIFLFTFLSLVNIPFSLYSSHQHSFFLIFPSQYSLFFLSYSLSFSTSSSFLLINIPFFLWYAFSLIFYFPFLPNPFLLISFSFFFVRDSEIYIYSNMALIPSYNLNLPYVFHITYRNIVTVAGVYLFLFRSLFVSLRNEF